MDIQKKLDEARTIYKLLDKGTAVAFTYTSGVDYDLVFTPLKGSYVSNDFMGGELNEQTVIVSIVNMGRSYVFRLLDPKEFFSASYISKKFHLSAPDSIAIAKLFNRIVEAGAKEYSYAFV